MTAKRGSRDSSSRPGNSHQVGGEPDAAADQLYTVTAGPSNESGPADNADARYGAALALVGRIDADLRRGTRYYRDKSGRLLVSLDEVTNAILNGGVI